MNPIQQIQKLGQSVWLDYIRRDLIESGELAGLIEKGEISGVTSNPTIFENAFSSSDLYTSDLRALAQAGWKPEAIFDRLAIDDIRAAADNFLPLYERTNGGDGYVSLEVSPKLADNTRGTLSEARRLWSEVNRPNVMIKIPATKAGITAIEQAIREGINVNVTLIFALQRYSEVIEAYLRGLEARAQAGESLTHVSSVASFFVSRVDTAVDRLLEEIIARGGQEAERAASLRGKAAIANAKLAYAQFEAAFSTDRFRSLAEKGARTQRPLWASTSTKNPAYPDTYYVDSLIGPDTVNTIPVKTLNFFRDHGTVELTLQRDLSAARAQLQALEALGISMADVTQQLEREGVSKFAASYRSLLATLRSRARAVRKELADLQPALIETLAKLESDHVAQRIWEHDASLWTHQRQAAQEVRQRLGWLTLPSDMRDLAAALQAFAVQLGREGFKQAVLLGMGGSSLASDVLRRTLATGQGMQFEVLDSTDPSAISALARRVKLERTLFIVASKSGSTAEPLALMEFFWAKVQRRMGEKAGQHFVAVTDPGTPLQQVAEERGFRRVFASPPDVGGRYSALTAFGLLSAALMGIDPSALLAGGVKAAGRSAPGIAPAHNRGLFLGAVLGAASAKGRAKLTFAADPGLEPFADWAEQLIAESSGKQGKGLTPIVGEPPGPASRYAEDRLMIYLRHDGTLDRRLRGWVRARLPVIVLEMDLTPESFGAAFFQWEFAIATACHLIGVNAFDQPDVQRAKTSTVKLLEQYERTGELPSSKTVWEGEQVRLLGPALPVKVGERGLAAVLDAILEQAREKGGLGLLLYLRQDGPTEKRLARLRRRVRDKLGIFTVAGFGPRYLHSTGQLYKGGPDRALYLFVTAQPKRDLKVPGKTYTFSVLERAQAIGDHQALLELGRPAYRLELPSPAEIRAFTGAFEAAIERVAR